MAVLGPAEIKIGYDVFSKLVNWLTKKRNNKVLEELKSQAFQELLKGESGDLIKVSALIKKIRNTGDTSVETERLESLYRGSYKRRKDGKSAGVKVGAAVKVKAAAKKPMVKKPAVKKTTVKKEAIAKVQKVRVRKRNG